MKRITFLFFVLYCIIACTESNEFLPQNEESEKDQSTLITVKNGMLVFPNDSIFALAMAGEVKLPFQMDFISQDDIFTQIMIEEEAHTDRLLEQGVEPTENDHSELYLEKLKSGFIKIIKYSDGSELYDLNLFKPQYAKILNERGFYAIGKNIYQITANSTKVWVNGDINNYQLLAKANNSEESKGIYIVTPNKENIQTSFKRFSPSVLDFTVKYAPTPTSNYRFYVKMYDRTTISMPPVDYKRESYARVFAQKKSGSKWNYYTNFGYTFSCRIFLEDEAGNSITPSTADFVDKSTGANVYYSIYLSPDWQIIQKEENIDKIPYVHSEEYIYMGRFYIGLMGDELTDKCNMYVETTCSGLGSNRTWRMTMGGGCEVVKEVGA